MKQKEKKLNTILKSLGSAVVAFSGGVDSSYLLYKAREVLGNNILAVTAVSEIFPDYETENACRLAGEMNIEHLLIETSELSSPDFVNNPPNRCYYCKKGLFGRLKTIAATEGYAFVCDGTNYDDSVDFRPGLQAAKEIGVRSPLLEAKLNKKELRQLSREAGLRNWDMPAAACLASRIPYGDKISVKKLKAIASAERFLMSLGHRVIRVRCHDKIARVEVAREEIDLLLQKKEDVVDYLKRLGFTYITVDLEGFRSGSINEALNPKKRI